MSAEPTFLSSGGSFLLLTLSKLLRQLQSLSTVRLFNLDCLTGCIVHSMLNLFCPQDELLFAMETERNHSQSEFVCASTGCCITSVSFLKEDNHSYHKNDQECRRSLCSQLHSATLPEDIETCTFNGREKGVVCHMIVVRLFHFYLLSYC